MVWELDRINGDRSPQFLHLFANNHAPNHKHILIPGGRQQSVSPLLRAGLTDCCQKKIAIVVAASGHNVYYSTTLK